MIAEAKLRLTTLFATQYSKLELCPLKVKHLKPSTETISLRLPAPLLSDLKALANRRDVPYQSLLKVFVADRVAEEWRALSYRAEPVSAPTEPTRRRRPKSN